MELIYLSCYMELSCIAGACHEWEVQVVQGDALREAIAIDNISILGCYQCLSEHTFC